ncbi:Uncharacterised protein [Vibrio paracholerae]|nr:Uncharacterised protein [Vibrio paracholerae]
MKINENKQFNINKNQYCNKKWLKPEIFHTRNITRIHKKHSVNP